MAEDNGKEEEKFDFTPEGEGYLTLDEAILSARQLVRQDEQYYLNRTGWEEIVWSTSESEAGDVSIKVILQFRRPNSGISEDAKGLEEFLFGYDGELQDRQVLLWPNNPEAPTAEEYESTLGPSFTPIATLNATQWVTKGSGDWELNYPTGVQVAYDGSVYVVELLNNYIKKFTSAGVFVTKWGPLGMNTWRPYGIAVASDGSVYVADSLNRIQKFTSEGVFVHRWGTEGTGDGQFDMPVGIAVASDGSVYVVDSLNRIQKFTSEGVFVHRWGTEGTGDGQFNGPYGIAVASEGSVYVAEEYNNRIQKFTSAGVFVSQWGRQGTSDGEFSHPLSVAVATDGSVYVADRSNDRIQKFTSAGVFVSKWGTPGAGDGQFYGPTGVTVASDDSVYVADYGNHRIQKFSVGQ